jgi:hypothetical protein
MPDAHVLLLIGRNFVPIELVDRRGGRLRPRVARVEDARVRVGARGRRVDERAAPHRRAEIRRQVEADRFLRTALRPFGSADETLGVE